MTGTAESLNLAVAVGILLYEIQRPVVDGPVVEVEHDLPA
jgi:tRNA C32,U32 (ribose-2'-O)-methylase TrmJ